MAVLQRKSPRWWIAAVLKANALCIFFLSVLMRREYVGS